MKCILVTKFGNTKTDVIWRNGFYKTVEISSQQFSQLQLNTFIEDVIEGIYSM